MEVGGRIKVCSGLFAHNPHAMRAFNRKRLNNIPSKAAAFISVGSGRLIAGDADISGK